MQRLNKELQTNFTDNIYLEILNKLNSSKPNNTIKKWGMEGTKQRILNRVISNGQEALKEMLCYFYSNLIGNNQKLETTQLFFT